MSCSRPEQRGYFAQADDTDIFTLGEGQQTAKPVEQQLGLRLVLSIWAGLWNDLYVMKHAIENRHIAAPSRTDLRDFLPANIE